jgi:hypothetical protein
LARPELFELVMCAAVGQSARLYEAGLAALAEAAVDREAGVIRLDILNDGYGPGTKLLFGLIRPLSGHPAPDAARLVFHRPDFYGARAKEFTHAAIRGPSAWSVGDGS